MVGTSILRVQAIDADTGDNAAVEYSFADGFTDAQFFSIDNRTGIISNDITLVSDKTIINLPLLTVNAG